MAGETESLTVLLSLRDTLSGAMAKPVAAIKSLQSSFDVLGKAAKIAFAGISGAAVLLARDLTKTSEELVKLNAITGISIEKLQKLGFVAEQNGSSLEGMSTGLRFLARNASAAVEGSEEAIDTFGRLGVKVKDSQGQMKPLEQLLNEVADALSNIDDPAERTELAMAALGRGGADLIPVLSKGSDEFEQYGKMLESVGGIIDTKTAKSLEIAGDQFGLLAKVGKAALAEITAKLGEFIPVAVDAFFEFAKNVNIAKNTLVVIGKAFYAFYEMIRDVVSQTVTLMRVFWNALTFDFEEMSTLWDDFSNNAKTAGELWGNYTAALDKAMEEAHKDIDSTSADLDGFNKKIQDALANIRKNGEEGAAAVKKTAQGLFGGGGNNVNFMSERDFYKLQKAGEKEVENQKKRNEEAKKAREEYEKIAAMDPWGGFNLALEEAIKNLGNFRDLFSNVIDSVTRSMSNAFEKMMTDGRHWKDAMRDFFGNIKQSFIKMIADIMAQQAVKQLAMLMLGVTSTAGTGLPGQSNLSTDMAVNQAALGGQQLAAGQAGGGGPGMLAPIGMGVGLAVGTAGEQRGNVGQSTAGYAMAGLMAGAQIGSLAGPVGTAIGAIVGGLGGAAYGFMSGSKAREEAKKAEADEEAAANEAAEQLEEQRKAAAMVLKTSISTQLGGGLATPEAMDAASKLFSGDVTSQDIADMGPGAAASILSQAGMVNMMAANQGQINVGAPVINVQVGQIASSYDAQKLAEDLGFHFVAAIQGQAAGA